MSEHDMHLLYALIPLWAKIEPISGLDPTFYGTGNYHSDVAVYERINTIFNFKTEGSV